VRTPILGIIRPPLAENLMYLLYAELLNRYKLNFRNKIFRVASNRDAFQLDFERQHVSGKTTN
jgi:hypothetical protein